MINNHLYEEDSHWGLSSAFWAESTKILYIRPIWVKYRDVILDNYPHCAKLSGKSGRGKTVFLLYLLFYILRLAKQLSSAVHDHEAPPPVHLTDPLIAYMDRERMLYLVTKDSICLFHNLAALTAAAGKPHFYFSDNVDVDDAGAGSLVTLALTSGDEDVLKNFSKRKNEARTKHRSELVMPGLALDEMLLVFPGMPKEAVEFSFDVVGGNPRLAFPHVLAIVNSAHYPLVRGVVDALFPAANEANKKKAVDVVCRAVDAALTQHDREAIDSGIFRDFVVTNEGIEEMFASPYMGCVASRLRSAMEESAQDTLLRLCGYPASSEFCEYVDQLERWEVSTDEDRQGPGGETTGGGGCKRSRVDTSGEGEREGKERREERCC